MHRPTDRGYSLVEVLIACLVASIFSFGILSALIPSVGLSQKDYDQTRALAFAEQYLETATKGASSVEAFAAITTTGYLAAGSDGLFVYRQEVTALETDLKRVSVTLYYADPQAKTPAPDASRPKGGRIVKLATLINSI